MICKYIYHYTTIDTLKNILASKTIKFSRMDLLNDPYEGLCYVNNDKNEELRKCVYTSCWTTSESENIALWHIYTNSRGVRFKIKSNLFGESFLINEHNGGFFPYVPVEAISLDDSCDLKISNVYGPITLTYVDRPEKIGRLAVLNSIINRGMENEVMVNDIDLIQLASIKINHWSYENECRFIVSPFSEVRGSESSLNSKLNRDFPRSVYVPFVNDVVEVITGPEISEAEFDSLKLFLDEHYPSINLVKSCIKSKLNMKKY